MRSCGPQSPIRSRSNLLLCGGFIGPVADNLLRALPAGGTPRQGCFDAGYQRVIRGMSPALTGSCIKLGPRQHPIETGKRQPSPDSQDLVTREVSRNLSATTVTTPGMAPSFVGRSREIDEIVRLLGHSRVVTIMGAPGAGKTRLALEVAARISKQFGGGGVYLCDLAPIVDPSLVPTAVATALGFAPEMVGDLGALVSDRIGETSTLILLDNCEHVTAEVGMTMHRILSDAPGLRMLATSRERLRMTGEAAWNLPSLSLEEALQLLAMRVAAVDATFAVNVQTRSALIEICERLERLPLALELVAPRLALLPAAEVLRMLSDALGLLTGGERRSRHQTMAAALDWSVRLLPARSARDLWRLSVFPARFTLQGVVTVLEASAAEAVDRVAVLRDASLLVADTTGVSARFRLLEPIRQYALAHLVGGPIEDDVRRLHAAYVVSRAEWIGARLLGTNEQAAALDAFVELLPDMRQALKWCHDAQPSWTGAIMGDTGWAWEITSRLREGEALERRALAVTSDHTVRARLLVRLASLVQRRDMLEPADLANQAIAEARQGESPRELALALCFSAAYDLSDSGEEKFREAVAIADETSDALIPVFASTFRGGRCALRHDFEAASAHQASALATSHAIGDPWLTTQATTNLVRACRQQNDLVSARKHLRAALSALIEHPHWLAAPYVLRESAFLASRTGRPADALRLASACRRIAGEIGIPIAQLAEAEETARGALAGRSKPAKHASEGERLSLMDALKLALDVAETPAQFASRRTARRDPATGLTERECEVVRLIAAGLTNREISAKLFITERSAEGHVERIRNKLDVRSRSQIAAWAEERGLATTPIDENQSVPRFNKSGT